MWRRRVWRREEEKEEEKEEEEEEEEGEEKEERKEHPDLLACRPCGLVFAHAWGLKDHAIRGCPVDESAPRDVKEKTMG